MTGQFYVEIIRIEDDGHEVMEKQLGPFNTRTEAEDMDEQASRNLDFMTHYTKVVPK